MNPSQKASSREWVGSRENLGFREKTILLSKEERPWIEGILGSPAIGKGPQSWGGRLFQNSLVQGPCFLSRWMLKAFPSQHIDTLRTFAGPHCYEYAPFWGRRVHQSPVSMATVSQTLKDIILRSPSQALPGFHSFWWPREALFIIYGMDDIQLTHTYTRWAHLCSCCDFQVYWFWHFSYLLHNTYEFTFRSHQSSN